MTVSVVIPYRAGDQWRAQARAWVEARYRAEHPDWELVRGGCNPDLPFNRSEAILDGAARATGDVLVVADADVWTDGTPEAVDRCIDTGWAIPHKLIHRLSQESTFRVLTGEPWAPGSMPLSSDNAQDRSPYEGNEAGTLVVLRRDVLDEVPPDRRFIGWGQEDQAWATALHTIVGTPWRGTADLVHLWHPAQPRENRTVGSAAGVELLNNYLSRVGRPNAMRRLVREGAPA